MTAVSKLFYIFPECAYAVELLPSKKPNSFTVHTFRQINGSFMDDNEFIAENVDKLIRKFDPETYQLILPDFLFTNTIIDIAETNEDAVIKHLKQNVLPDLGLNTQDHYLETFILTQHQKKSKVQLSALEKSVLTPLLDPATEQNIHFESVIPLSWSVKSAISLEPSLSTIQMGEKLYVAQHYIGVDQAIVFDISETKNIIETVKTLKGAEPNIQTMYLFTNSLVENELKEHLSGTLPLQQLANQVEAHDEMPAHVRYIVETAARTLSITDYPVPHFIPEQSVKGATSKALPIATLSESDKPASAAGDTTTTADELPSDDGDDKKEDMKADSPIPSPTMPPTSKAAKAKTAKAEPKEDTPKATVAIEDITPVDDTDTADSLAKPAASVAAAATALGAAASVASAATSAATSVVPAASVSSESALMASGQPTPPSVSSDSKPAAAVVDITEKILKTPESSVTTTSAKTEPKDISAEDKNETSMDKPKSISLSDSEDKTPVVTGSEAEKDAGAESGSSVAKPSEDVPASGVKIEPTSAAVAEPVTSGLTASGDSTETKISPDSSSTVSSTVAAPAAVASSTAKETMSDTSAAATTASSSSGEVKPMRPVLKKKNDAGSLLKIVFATVAALVVTVAIGVGIGFGLLKMNQKKPVTQQPVASPKATVAPTPAETTTTTATGSGTTTSASGSAALAKAKIKILVVNATKVAGKAGKTKSTLTAAGYKLVDTGNAKGEYTTAGTYILVSKTAPVGLNTDLAKELKVTSGDAADQLAAEDPKGEYDAVIVLNE